MPQFLKGPAIVGKALNQGKQRFFGACFFSEVPEAHSPHVEPHLRLTIVFLQQVESRLGIGYLPGLHEGLNLI